jgi:hypothetical protein
MPDIQVLSIFMFCLIGCGFTSWHVGKNHGIEMAVQYLIDQGVLEINEE